MSTSEKVDQRPTLDQLTTEIVMIAGGIKKLRESRINDDTLYLLIQNSIGCSYATGNKPVSLKTIRAVIEGIEALDTKHLKKKGVKQ